MLQHHKKLSLDLDNLLPEGLQPDETTAASSSAFQWKARGSAKSRVKPLRSDGDLESLGRQDGRRSTDAGDQRTGQFDVNGHPARVCLSQQGLEWTYAPGRGCLPGPTSTETVPFQEMLAVQPLDPVGRGVLQCVRIKVHRFMVYTFRRDPRERSVWSPRRLVFESSADSAEDVVKDWRARLAAGVATCCADRPTHLLVVLNPNSGARRARTVYSRIVEPVFRAAGVKATVMETKYANHAHTLVEQLRLEDVEGIDGIVAVGGDGVFHEVMNGFLQLRASAGPQLQARLLQLRLAHIPAGSTDAVACTLHGTRSVFTAAMHIALGDRTELDILRVDTGEGATRFASCIAAYGFMGDVMASSEAFRWLGPARYDLVGAAKLASNRAYRAKVSYLQGAVYHNALAAHSVCGANCPVCRAASFVRKSNSPSAPSLLASPPPSVYPSPARPALEAELTEITVAPTSAAVGATHNGTEEVMVLPILPRQSAASPPLPSAALAPEAISRIAGGSSPLRVRPNQAKQSSGTGALAVLDSSPTQRDFLQPAFSAAERHQDADWKHVEDAFVSIMLIIMPCRSEKTKQGMARFGHLADGRLKLVLVRRCNALQYLGFLLSMSRTGVFPGQHPYVDVIDAVAVRVECQGKQSHWNLDGELLSTQCLSAEVHQGLVEVFARGVER